MALLSHSAPLREPAPLAMQHYHFVPERALGLNRRHVRNVERQVRRIGGEVDAEVILRCVRTKLAVVAEDERDDGRRQVLNLGHTVAHAIEAATGYTRYRHGEAVAYGADGQSYFTASEKLVDAPPLYEYRCR